MMGGQKSRRLARNGSARPRRAKVPGTALRARYAPSERVLGAVPAQLLDREAGMSRNRLRWDDIPDGASIAISKKSAMEIRGGGPKTFFSGMVCGAVCLLMLPSCGLDDRGDKQIGRASVKESVCKYV